MYDTLPTREEAEFLRYQDFAREVLATKRANIARPLGEYVTDLATFGVTPIAFGMAKVSRPYTGELETPSPEAYTAPTIEQFARPLGKEAIYAANTTPNQAIRAQARTGFALAA